MIFEQLATLPLTVETVDIFQYERETSSDFTRTTTVFVLAGPDATGVGEDVTYDTADHERLAERLPDLPVPFEGTFVEFSAALSDVDLFPDPPEREDSRHYRRWAVESAALDLALKESDTDLASALGRSLDPVRFVVSTRLGDPPSTDRIESILSAYPDTEFKLDPTDGWTADLVDSLSELDRVRTLDLKGAYEGTSVDQAADSELYELVIEGFPEAVIEDPAVTPETKLLLEPERNRIAWDYPITGLDSLHELPFEPAWINIKPSRFGTVESLLSTIEYCLGEGILLYGGGQFELGVGREHIQTLASIFYPDAPNDVAPSGYNEPEVSSRLLTTPLEPSDRAAGLHFGMDDTE